MVTITCGTCFMVATRDVGKGPTTKRLYPPFRLYEQEGGSILINAADGRSLTITRKETESVTIDGSQFQGYDAVVAGLDAKIYGLNPANNASV